MITSHNVHIPGTVITDQEAELRRLNPSRCLGFSGCQVCLSELDAHRRLGPQPPLDEVPEETTSVVLVETKPVEAEAYHFFGPEDFDAVMTLIEASTVTWHRGGDGRAVFGRKYGKPSLEIHPGYWVVKWMSDTRERVEVFTDQQFCNEVPFQDGNQLTDSVIS